MLYTVFAIIIMTVLWLVLVPATVFAFLLIGVITLVCWIRRDYDEINAIKDTVKDFVATACKLTKSFVRGD